MINYTIYRLKKSVINDFQSLIPSTWIYHEKCPKIPCFVFTQCETRDDIKNLAKFKILHPNITFIILSRKEDLVYDCFDIDIFDFIRIESLGHDMNRVIEHINKSSMIYKFSTTSIALSTISYIESFAHTVTIHTSGADIRQSRSISKLEKELEPYGFIRIHRFYLINKKHIQSIKGQEIILTNQIHLPIGKTYLQKVNKP